MGMGREMMEEAMIHDFAERIIQENRTTWNTKDGRKIRIVDMETEHILNCISMLAKNGREAPKEMYKVLEHRRLSGETSL